MAKIAISIHFMKLPKDFLFIFGENNGKFSMEDNKKKYQFHLRLTKSELEMFKEKAKNYKRMSSMVCDAVAQFDDVATLGKIDALNELSSLWSKVFQEISRQGNNLNQTVKRANELFLMGELNEDYYKEVIKPIVDDIQKTWVEISKQQDLIRKKLVKL